MLTSLPRELFFECCLVSTDEPAYQKLSKQFLIRRHERDKTNLTLNTCSYLSFYDWVKLDIALTSKKCRNDYMSIIEGCSIPYPDDAIVSNHSKFLIWAYNRKLRLRKVVLSMSTLDSLRSMQSLGHLKHIQEFLIQTPRRDEFHATYAVVIKCSEHLTILNFDFNDRITCPALKKILKNCPTLRDLSLRSCRYINDHALPYIATFVPNLERLNISKCIITNERLLQHVSRLQQLKMLNLTSCSISYRAVTALLTQLPQLEEFYIDNLMGSLQRTMITLVTVQLNAFQEQLATFGGKFVAFSMQACSLLTDNHLLPWLRSAHDLRYLSLESCSKVTDQTLLAVSEHCPQLQAINLRDCAGITDIGIITLAQSCHQLVDVALDGCFQLTTSAISSFANRKSVRLTYSNCNRIISLV